MNHQLTPLQHSVIQRLHAQGLSDVAEEAPFVWSAGQRLNTTLIHLADEQLRADFEKANRQAVETS